MLAHAIARSSLAGDVTFQAAIQDRSVTPLRFALLELVGTNPGLQQVQLAEALDLSRPAVTLLIDYWQARHCLERRSDAGDRRSFGIFLTEEGACLLADLRRRVLLHERMFAAPLSEGERRELGRLLQKLHGGKDMPGD
jgi:DNA-binding MarR family transcriptional regulator